ncbi:amidohydrolase [Thermodesulfobacteriota bacterium]
MSDLILMNANIITLGNHTKKAQLLAIKDGNILAVKSNKAIAKLKDRKSNIIDCQGKTVLPGFLDSHIHIHAFAEKFVTINLDPGNHVRSISDIQSKIRAQAKRIPTGTWIRCKGYNEFYLKEKQHPTRWDLDRAAPNHPIKLSHRTGHAHVLNSLALDRVGISNQTPDPPGGLIDRNYQNGEPTGLLFEMRKHLSKHIPPLEKNELERGIKKVNHELLSMGITSVQDASSYNYWPQWENFRYWKKNGLLKPRIKMMLGADSLNNSLNIGQKQDYFNQEIENQLQINGIKIILDETTGELVPSQDELNQLVLKTHGAGLQVAIHAIEESAVESACSAIEYALRKIPKEDHRHRIEHCSVCSPGLSKRIASLGIFIVTHPTFVYYHGDRYLNTISKMQRKHLYPIGSFLKKGVHVSAGSDCPVAPVNPLAGIYAAVARMTAAGKVISPKEKILPIDALKLYTHNAARAGFEENKKGSITPGKLADLIILSDDPIRMPDNELLELEVEMTIINGEIVWEKS